MQLRAIQRAEMAKLIPLSRDVNHYNEALRVFWKNTNQQEATQVWLRKNLQKVLLQKQAERSTISEDFNVLAVGSGDGEIDLVLLTSVTDFLKKRKPGADAAARIFYRVIEPYKSAVDAFKTSLAYWREVNEEDELAVGVSFDWVEDTWQHYQDKCQLKPENKFHLAHFIQICYHVDMEDVIFRCMEDQLAENGVMMVIMLSAEDTYVDHFTKQFYESGILEEPFSGMEKRNTEQVCAIAKKHGWKHDVYHFDFSINTTAMVGGDESDKDGNLLLDFLTTTVDFRAVTEKSSLEKTMKFWQNESKENEKNENILTGKHGVVLIYK